MADRDKLVRIPDPGSSVKVPGKLFSVTASADGLMAIIDVEGGRIVVPYWAVDVTTRMTEYIASSNDRLWSIVESAPHQLDCSRQTHAGECDCWKAEIDHD